MFTYAETSIPNGDAGTIATLKAMARLVREDVIHPLVRELAASIIQPYAKQDTLAWCEAIRAWCASAVQFTRDPSDRELLHSPEAMIRQWRESHRILGDCDDAAILAAALGVAVGCRARFVAVAFLDKQNPYGHVWAEIAPPTGTGDGWIECDVTRSFQNVPTHLISRLVVFPVVS